MPLPLNKQPTGKVLGAITLTLVGIALLFGLLVPLSCVLGSAFVIEEKTHLAAEGETLALIAKQREVDLVELRRLNPHLKDPLEVGTKVVVKAGGFSLSLFADTFKSQLYRRQFLNSLMLGLMVTFLCLIVATPVAVVANRYAFPGKALVQVFILLPLILPPFVGAVGIKRMLGHFGFFNLLLMNMGLTSEPMDFLGAGRFWAVAVLETLHLFPVMYLNLQAALAARDESLEDAAETLGDTPMGAFFRVTLPQLVPGIFAGSAIVFIWAFTDLGTPLVLEYQNVISRQIFAMVNKMDENPVGYALVVETLLAALVVFVVGRLLAARFKAKSSGKGTTAAVPRPLNKNSTIAFWVGFGALIFLTVLPHAALILNSFSEKWFMTMLPGEYTSKHYTSVMQHPMTAGSIRNSVLLSLSSTGLDVIVAVLIGLLATRWLPRWGKAADALAMVPLAVPGIIIAYGFMAAYGGIGQGKGLVALLFSWMDPRLNPMPLLVLSYAIRRLPYTTRAVAAGLTQVPEEVEEASAVLGASEPQTLRRVTIPLIRGHILAGAMLTFSFAMLEVSDSLVLAQEERFYPITKAIYHMTMRLVDGLSTASALGVFAMALLLFALLGASKLSKRSLGEILRL